MKTIITSAFTILALVAIATAIDAQTIANAADPSSREFYQAYDAAFARNWKTKTGKEVVIKEGGAAADADVVTLVVAADIDALAARGLTAADWRTRLPQNSSPIKSAVVFLIRKGNPKAIKDWNDLTRGGIRVITPDPKSSGAGRWNYLAAFGYALKQPGGTNAKARNFAAALLRNVPALEADAAGAMATFMRASGDVLLASESEALLAVDQARDRIEMVTPSISILVEPTVAVVDTVAARKGTSEVATAYLQYLYSAEGQDIAARFHFRRGVATPTLFTIDELFGGWQTAQKAHFANGGSFDQVYEPGVIP